jgi:hypothetical protein|tara:strand:+ start:326 stop:493 length:168 start_codon:yes stop_codon:yes gene_type:complete
MSAKKYRTVAIYDDDHADLKQLAADNARSIPKQISFMVRELVKQNSNSDNYYGKG